MAQLVLLSNNFHHTTYCIRLPPEGILSIHQIRRIRKWLCGTHGCWCGETPLKTRGPQAQHFLMEAVNNCRQIKLVLTEEAGESRPCTICYDYLHPIYWDHPLAAEWNQYLADHLIWNPEDFGQGYAWEVAIPPMEAWGVEVRKVNDHLRHLMVFGAEKGYSGKGQGDVILEDFAEK